MEDGSMVADVHILSFRLSASSGPQVRTLARVPRQRRPGLLIHKVTPAFRTVCEIPASNVGILRQSYRADTWRRANKYRRDTWRPLAQPAGRLCRRRIDKHYLRDVSREAV